MNRKDIIRMAREAGFTTTDRWDRDFMPLAGRVERFAALVAAATAKEYEERLRFTRERWEIECQSQVEIEREACAKVCEELDGLSEDDPGSSAAAAIRARGQA